MSECNTFKILNPLCAESIGAHIIEENVPMKSRSNLTLATRLGAVSLASLSLMTACGGSSGKGDGAKPDVTEKTATGTTGGASNFDLQTAIVSAPASDKPLRSSVFQTDFALSGSDATNPALTFDSYQCRIGDAGDWIPCGGKPFTLSGLQGGVQYRISVRALLRDSATQRIIIAREATSVFVVDLSGGDQAGSNVGIPGSLPPPGLTGQPVRTLATALQLGAFYRANVPAGMHVTEFSTSKTTGVLSVFRILPESDPYYLGNFACNRGWDRLVNAITPAGEQLAYCHSTPTRAAWKADNEYRLAMNHIEIATDTKVATPENYERLSVSIYDADRELTRSSSRFWNACLNSTIKSIRVPMVNNFFYGRNPEQVDFYYCDTIMAGPNGESETWRVGAFHDVDAIDWNCSECTWGRAIEVTYMARANSRIFLTDDFAKFSQKRVLDFIEKVRP